MFNLNWKWLLMFMVFAQMSWLSGYAQAPGESIDELLNSLKGKKRDTSRVMLYEKLSSFYLSKPSRTRIQLDSCFFYANELVALSKAAKYSFGEAIGYRYFGKYFRTKGNDVKGKYFTLKSIDILKQQDEYLLLGEVYYDMTGFYFYYGDQATSRIKYAELSLAAFQRAGDKYKMAAVHQELADLYSWSSRKSEALVSAKRALVLYQEIGYKSLQGIYDLIGSISRDQGDWERAIRYGLLALSTAHEAGDNTMQLSTIENRLGVTYHQIRQLDKAIEHFAEGIRIAKRLNNNDAVITITCNLVNSMTTEKDARNALKIMNDMLKEYKPNSDYERVITLCRLIGLYRVLKRFDEAEKASHQLKSIISNYKDTDLITSVTLGTLARLYIDEEKFDMAEEYLKQSDEAYYVQNDRKAAAENQLLWFKMDTLQGRFLSSIRHYQLYKWISDSLLTEAKSRQIEQLQMEFDNEKRDQLLVDTQKNIELLTHQAEIQESSLRKVAYTRNVVIAGIILLLVIGYLLVVNSKYKLRNNETLKLRSDEINDKNNELNKLLDQKQWLVSEIHHRVKNSFHIVMSLLGTQSQYIKNENALKAIEESQYRIQTMALMHQKLFESGSISSIDMRDYITSLVRYLKDSFELKDSITFNLRIDPIKLHLSYSQPIGMIISEAITNSIKHGFLNGSSGIITTSLHQKEDHIIELTISDNGGGFQYDQNSHRESMGMNLISGLSQEMEGSCTIENKDGTHILIRFRYDVALV